MSRNTSIVVTVITAFLCGCPGLFLCVVGGITATGWMPYTVTVNGITNQGLLPSSYGVAILCVSLILMAIPVVIGVVTLRRKPAPAVDNEPLPPAS